MKNMKEEKWKIMSCSQALFSNVGNMYVRMDKRTAYVLTYIL